MPSSSSFAPSRQGFLFPAGLSRILCNAQRNVSQALVLTSFRFGSDWGPQRSVQRLTILVSRRRDRSSHQLSSYDHGMRWIGPLPLDAAVNRTASSPKEPRCCGSISALSLLLKAGSPAPSSAAVSSPRKQPTEAKLLLTLAEKCTRAEAARPVGNDNAAAEPPRDRRVHGSTLYFNACLKAAGGQQATGRLDAALPSCPRLVDTSMTAASCQLPAPSCPWPAAQLCPYVAPPSLTAEAEEADQLAALVPSNSIRALLNRGNTIGGKSMCATSPRDVAWSGGDGGGSSRGGDGHLEGGDALSHGGGSSHMMASSWDPASASGGDGCGLSGTLLRWGDPAVDGGGFGGFLMGAVAEMVEQDRSSSPLL